MRNSSWYRTLLPMLTTALLMAPGALRAQSDLPPGTGFEGVPRIGIGYVTNAPNIFAGASVYGLTGILGGLGLYVDTKISTSSPADEVDFVTEWTAAEIENDYEDQIFREDGFEWWSVNAAILRPISPELMLYVGAGYTDEKVYRRYNDPSDELGEDVGTFGYYWVEDPDASGGKVNFLGGAFFRMTRHVALQFGLESEPGGFTVGGSYSFRLP